jgi:DHA2 family lincomycin resistance protein-like MFS transporter
MAFFGAITVVPLYLQDVLQVTPLVAGLVVLPGALAMGLTGPAIGRIYDRWGTMVLLVPGAVITSGMLWFYTTFTLETPVWVIAVAQTVLSIGLALSFTPLFTASLGSLEPRFYSYGSAVLGTVQQVAGAAGIALMFGVMAAASAAASASGADALAAQSAGTHAAFLTAALLSLPLLVGAFLIRKPADQIGVPAEGEFVGH